MEDPRYLLIIDQRVFSVEIKTSSNKRPEGLLIEDPKGQDSKGLIIEDPEGLLIEDQEGLF